MRVSLERVKTFDEGERESEGGGRAPLWWCFGAGARFPGVSRNRGLTTQTDVNWIIAVLTLPLPPRRRLGEIWPQYGGEGVTFKLFQSDATCVTRIVASAVGESPKCIADTYQCTWPSCCTSRRLDFDKCPLLAIGFNPVSNGLPL